MVRQAPAVALRHIPEQQNSTQDYDHSENSLDSDIPETDSAERVNLQPREFRVGLLRDYPALGEEGVEFRSRRGVGKKSCSSELMVEESMIVPYL